MMGGVIGPRSGPILPSITVEGRYNKACVAGFVVLSLGVIAGNIKAA